jgi:hypothetical protein
MNRDIIVIRFTSITEQEAMNLSCVTWHENKIRMISLTAIIIQPDDECSALLTIGWWMDWTIHLDTTKCTLTRVYDGSFGWNLGFVNLSWGFYLELILYLLIRIDSLRLLLEFFRKPKSSSPGEFLQIINSIVFAAQHTGIGCRWTNSHLLVLVNQVEASDHLLISF